MLRQSLLGIVIFLTIASSAFADKIIKLSPNESKSITNSTLWTVKAICNVQSKNANSKIRVSVLENKGEVNGKQLAMGQATSVILKHQDRISVSAEPGTVVMIVNTGNDSVEAVCTA
jgi:hypothetical protein